MARNITLVVPALHGGGAERIAAQMADHWSSRGDRITLVTLDAVESDVYSPASEVERVGLGLMQVSRYPWQAIWNNLRRLHALRQVIRHSSPACVVSLTDRMNIMTLLACRPLTVPVVIAEHSDPRHQQLGYVWEWLRRRTYPACAAAVVLTSAVADYLRPLVATGRLYVIPNAAREISERFVDANSDRNHGILAMGRLSCEKGFDLLIQAFARIASNGTDWRLDILGEGPQRTSLEQLARQLEVADRVTFHGWVDEPEKYLLETGIFVLASRYEGFPVALLEAMACKAPVVSFDCDSGPREIIRHQQDGWLVPAQDVGALADALERLIANPSLRARLGQAAGTVSERFSSEQFFQRWDQVLVEACASHAGNRQSDRCTGTEPVDPAQ